MKQKIITAFLAASFLAFASCNQGKKDAAEKDVPADSTEQVTTKTGDEMPPRKDIYELKEVKDGWKVLSIPVENAAGDIDVVQLAKAFNRAWPTAIGNTLTLKSEGKSIPPSNGYPDLKVKTDKAGGYIEALCSKGGDGEDMIVSVVDRENGHKLLLVCLAWPIANVDQFLCAYDYDSSTAKLTPEDSPAADFKGLLQKPYLNYVLPQGSKEFVIEEDAGLTLRHIYRLDGNNFKVAGIRIGEQDKLIQLFNEDKAEDGGDRLTKWALIDIDQDGVNEVWMRADNDKNGAFFAFSDFDGPQLLLSETSRFRPTLAPGRVTVGGPAGGPSYYTNTVTVKNSQREHELTCMQVYEDCEYSLDGKDITTEEGKAFQATISKKIYEPKVEWHKLMP